MLRLEIQIPGAEPFYAASDRQAVVIGRSESADISVNYRFLSREHARFLWDGDQLFVEDLSSTNLTLFEGKPVGRPRRLKPGDAVQLSNVWVKILSEDERPPEGRGSELVIRSTHELLERLEDGRPASQEEWQLHAQRCRVLNEIHKALAQFLDLDALLELIVDRVFDLLQPEEAVIYVAGSEPGTEVVAGRGAERGAGLLSKSLERVAMEEGGSVLVNEVGDDSRFKTASSIIGSGTRSLVAAPLWDEGRTKGMIVLGSRTIARRFTEADMEMLVSVASVAALYIRNLELREEALQRRRMEQDLALGREIQVMLISRELPAVPGYEFEGRNVPSRTVSGDYFIAVERDRGRTILAMIVDVSGKGLEAALVTTYLEAMVTGLLQVVESPEEICSIASRQLFERIPAAKYATAFVAVVEIESGKLRYVNAGHDGAFLIRSSGGRKRLPSTGHPLGLFPDSTFDWSEVTLHVGDLVVFYTDGITEARSQDEEEFGVERLLKIAEMNCDLPLQSLASKLEEEVAEFTNNAPPLDDRTLLLIRRCS